MKILTTLRNTDRVEKTEIVALTRRSALKLSLLVAAPWAISSAHQSSAQNNDSRKNKKVIIIGAGMAGITTAKELLASGYNVTILESRGRSGGRILTSKIGDIPIDMGAAWIHGDTKENPLIGLVKKHKLQTAATNWDETWFYSDGTDEIEDKTFNSIERKAAKVINQIHRIQLEAEKNQSMESTIEKLLSEVRGSSLVKKGVRWWISSEIEAVSAANYKDLSLYYWDQDEGFEGEDLILLKGYGSLIKKMSEGVHIEYDKKVESINYGREGIEISGKWGSINGDLAVVTVPLGVLKADTIEFTPPLPEEKQRSIHKLKMGLLNKVVIEFDKRFWPSKAHRLGIISNSTSDRMEFFPARPRSKNAVLVCLNYGDYARSLESKSNQEITDIVLAQLKQIYPQLKTSNILDVNVTRWHADPHSRGAYTYVPINASLEDCEVLSRPVDKNLLFAGESTSYYFGTVHGAYLSGLRAAKQAISFLG